MKTWGYYLAIKSEEELPKHFIESLLKVLAEIGRIEEVNVESLGEVSVEK